MATDQEFLNKILDEIQQVRRLLEQKGTGHLDYRVCLRIVDPYLAFDSVHV